MTATIRPLLLWCQSDRPFELRVFSLVNHAHAAFAELGGDLVLDPRFRGSRLWVWGYVAIFRRKTTAEKIYGRTNPAQSSLPCVPPRPLYNFARAVY